MKITLEERELNYLDLMGLDLKKFEVVGVGCDVIDYQKGDISITVYYHQEK